MPGRITSWKGIETFIELIHRLKRPIIDRHCHGACCKNKKTYFKSSKRWHQTLIWMRLKFICDGRPDIENVYKISSIVFNLSSKAEPLGEQ